MAPISDFKMPFEVTRLKTGTPWVRLDYIYNLYFAGRLAWNIPTDVVPGLITGGRMKWWSK